MAKRHDADLADQSIARPPNLWPASPQSREAGERWSTVSSGSTKSHQPSQCAADDASPMAVAPRARK
jgi:hypothetical protein